MIYISLYQLPIQIQLHMIQSFTPDGFIQQATTNALQRVLEETEVPPPYHKIICAYFPSLRESQKQALIEEEVNQIKAGSSRHGLLIMEMQRRKQVLFRLRNLLEVEQGKLNLSTLILSEITQLLSELRTNNLVLVEGLGNLHRQGGRSSGRVPECIKEVLLELDSDNNFLKESVLNRFMLFHDEFDPFFLYHLEQKDKEKLQFKHPAIDKIFNIDIVFAARFRKAQRLAMRMLNLIESQPVQFKIRSRSYDPPKNIKLIETTPKQQPVEPKSKRSFKIRSLSLQQSNQSALKPSQVPIRHSIIRKSNFRILTEAIPDDKFQDEEPVVVAATPIKHKRVRFHRSRFFHEPQSQANQQPIQIKQHSFNFKQRLAPLFSKQIKQDQKCQKISLNLLKKEFIQPIVEDEQSELKSTNDSQIKEIKMRASKLSLNQLHDYLRSHSITQDISKEIIINNFQLSLAHSQSYFSEFLINGEVKAVGLSIQIPDGDYLIRLWAPLHNCHQNTNKLLFKKYLEYLERQTMCNKIYYFGPSKQLAIQHQFNCLKDLLLVRNRMSSKKGSKLQFAQFLSFKCSNILFQQANSTISMLFSDEIEAFNESNYYIEPALAEIDQRNMTQDLLIVAKISHQINNMKALNSLLEDQQFDTFAVTSAMNITNISALRLASTIHFATPFVAGEGYFKFKGYETYRKQANVICQIQGDNNFAILVGKGFKNMHSFVHEAKSITRKPCEFSVKMFNKQLYGRMVNNSLKLCSYANWEFSLSLKDELQGRVKHSMTENQIFGPEAFYLAVQMRSQILFCFEVGRDDFLY